MNSELKAFIYEAYNRGDINIEDVENIIGDIDDCDITEAAYLAADAEITEAENIFIETAMNYAAGNVDVAVFEKKAEGIGAKVKSAWEKFKKWVKLALDKLKKKLFDFTGTFYVDKSKWTRMQKIDAALQKARNNFLPIANQQYDKNIDTDVQFGKKIQDCFADLFALVSVAAVPVGIVAAGAVTLTKINVNAINEISIHIGEACGKIIEVADKSNSTVVKGVMKVLRPVLNYLNKEAIELKRTCKTVDDYRDNVRKLKKDLKSTAAKKALEDNGYDSTDRNINSIRFNSAIS